MIDPKFVLALVILASEFFTGLEAKCPKTCDLALGSYYIANKSVVGLDLNLTYIASLFQMTHEQALIYNPAIPNKDYIQDGQRVNVNFSCDCVNNSFLGHTFQYPILKGDTYQKVANYYANLTNVYSLTKFNPSYSTNNITDGKTMNCSYGNSSISDQYGLFEMHQLQHGENASSVASEYNISAQLVQEYNPSVNFSSVGANLYLPARGQNL